MRNALPFFALVALLALAACTNRDVVPLIGEDPEVYELLGERPPEDPTTSPIAAARRLHQALAQGDTEVVWTLLAVPTRRALDERGAVIGTSGRELLDASTLPGPGGTLHRVSYEDLLFGTNVTRLALREPVAEGAREGVVYATSGDGGVTELRFVLEEDGWKLHRTNF